MNTHDAEADQIPSHEISGRRLCGDGDRAVSAVGIELRFDCNLIKFESDANC
jgi:hypothetical protein